MFFGVLSHLPLCPEEKGFIYVRAPTTDYFFVDVMIQSDRWTVQANSECERTSFVNREKLRRFFLSIEHTCIFHLEL